MDTKELVLSQVAESGFQVSKALEGLTGEQWDAKVTEEAMSPREILDHLADCCMAVIHEVESVKHEWGQVSLPADADLAQGELAKLRALAVEALKTLSDDQAAHLGFDYFVLHDAYHVGQIALLRLKLGGWNPMSIYRM